jgi:hypothetical protein
MQNKLLYEYIFTMMDYGDRLAEMINLNDAGNIDNGNYFISLVYIEDMLDKYARGLVLHSSEEAGLDGSEQLKLANQRMDQLRANIRRFVQQGEFDDLLQKRGRQFYEDWHKLPPDHPNAQVLQ